MRRSSRTVGIFLVLFSLMALFASLSRARVTALHGSDIVGLLGAGACMGIGIIGLFGRLRIRDE